jgi:hypothetical protein
LFAAMRGILSGAHGPWGATNAGELLFLREDAFK